VDVAESDVEELQSLLQSVNISLHSMSSTGSCQAVFKSR
jgi:hypothetical protein